MAEQLLPKKKKKKSKLKYGPECGHAAVSGEELGSWLHNLATGVAPADVS